MKNIMAQLKKISPKAWGIMAALFLVVLFLSLKNKAATSAVAGTVATGGADSTAMNDLANKTNSAMGAISDNLTNSLAAQTKANNDSFTAIATTLTDLSSNLNNNSTAADKKINDLASTVNGISNSYNQLKNDINTIGQNVNTPAAVTVGNVVYPSSFVGPTITQQIAPAAPPIVSTQAGTNIAYVRPSTDAEILAQNSKIFMDYQKEHPAATANNNEYLYGLKAENDNIRNGTTNR